MERYEATSTQNPFGFLWLANYVRLRVFVDERMEKRKQYRGAMQDIGLHQNQKKCSVVHVKRGAQVSYESGMRMDETTTITALGEGKHYKFLGVVENVRQDERLALACAA